MDLEELVAKWEKAFNEIQHQEKVVQKEENEIWKVVYEIEFDEKKLKEKAEELMEEENYGPKLAKVKAKEELLDEAFSGRRRKNKTIIDAANLIEQNRAVFMSGVYEGQLVTVESMYRPAFDVAKALAETLKKEVK